MYRVTILLLLVTSVLITEASLPLTKAKRAEAIAQIQDSRMKRQADMDMEYSSSSSSSYIKEDLPGLQPGDPDLCLEIEIDEFGNEVIPDWMSICDRKIAKNGREKRYCILSVWICDVGRDCFDWSDELGCIYENRKNRKITE